MVPTYRRPHDLENFLVSIESQLIRHSNVRLVVVNDGSHDDAYQAATAPFRHLIDYRIQPENRGVQFARHAESDLHRFSASKSETMFEPDGDFCEMTGKHGTAQQEATCHG